MTIQSRRKFTVKLRGGVLGILYILEGARSKMRVFEEVGSYTRKKELFQGGGEKGKRKEDKGVYPSPKLTPQKLTGSGDSRKEKVEGVRGKL